MSRKGLVWGGMIVGSTVGAFVPYLWGNVNAFSFASVICTTIGGLVGIWVGFKLAD